MDSKTYAIEGYEEVPIEIENSINFLDEIKNTYVKDNDKMNLKKG